MGGDGGVADEAREREQEREYAAALMARIRSGDERALAELMRAHASQLTNVAYSLLDDWDSALEVSQDVFVMLWEQRTTIDIHSNVIGYLIRAVRNRALNVLKQERRWTALLDATIHGRGDVSRVAINDAERTLDEADVARQLWQHIQMIPESPRRVFLLSWHLRLSYAEIATLLGVKVATVHQLMFRATKRLAELYRNT